MSSREGQDDAVIGAELLTQLGDNATVLGVYDEGQDIALDLHEGLFSPPLSSGRWPSSTQTATATPRRSSAG